VRLLPSLCHISGRRNGHTHRCRNAHCTSEHDPGLLLAIFGVSIVFFTDRADPGSTIAGGFLYAARLHIASNVPGLSYFVRPSYSVVVTWRQKNRGNFSVDIHSCDRTLALGMDSNEGRGVRSLDILRWYCSRGVGCYQSKVKVNRQI
jgi:hypothetical protein